MVESELPSLDARPDLPQLSFALHHYRHLRKLHSYVLANSDQPLQLAEVAAHVGISPGRLSRLFQEKTGIAYSVWIRLERVARAAALLSRSDSPISEIAIGTGFQNSRTLERTFKQITGVTPTEYRRQKQQQQMSQK